MVVFNAHWQVFHAFQFPEQLTSQTCPVFYQSNMQSQIFNVQAHHYQTRTRPEGLFKCQLLSTCTVFTTHYNAGADQDTLKGRGASRGSSEKGDARTLFAIFISFTNEKCQIFLLRVGANLSRPPSPPL